MCRTHCDRTPVQMVFVAKLSPVRCIKMRISALLPILNVNKSLSQSNNGLIVCHWYWLIFTQTLHVYSCHIRWAIVTHKAWGYHGFLPKPKIYHAQLQEVVLSSFWTYSSRLRNVRLPLGPTGSIHADIVTCLFVIQDMQEGDVLCGCYGPHTPQVQRHFSWSCNVTYADLDSPYFTCPCYLFAKPMAMIAASDDKAICVRWSQHAVHNAFQDVLSGELLLKLACSSFNALISMRIHSCSFLVLSGLCSCSAYVDIRFSCFSLESHPQNSKLSEMNCWSSRL